MADPQRELQEAFHRMIDKRATMTLFSATVTEVDTDAMTCTVVDSDEIEIYDVRLRAATGDADGFILVPALNSTVIVGNIGNSENAFLVIETTALDSIRAVIGNTRLDIKSDSISTLKGTSSIEVKADGLYLTKGAESLKKILDDLLVQIKLITVSVTAVGSPTGTPLNFAAFDALKVRVDNLLK